MAVSFDLEGLQLSPEKDMILMEMIHAVSINLFFYFNLPKPLH